MQRVVWWVRVAVLVTSLGLFWALLVPRFFPWMALLCTSLVLPVVLWPRGRTRG